MAVGADIGPSIKEETADLSFGGDDLRRPLKRQRVIFDGVEIPVGKYVGRLVPAPPSKKSEAEMRAMIDTLKNVCGTK